MQNILFENIMLCIWGDNNPPHDYVIKATADKLRGTGYINHENALDVLDHLGTEFGAIIDVRGSDVEGEVDTAIYTIKFHDGSSALIIAPKGIGSAIEVL